MSNIPFGNGVPITDNVVTGASFTAGKMTLTKQVGADITASVGGVYAAQVTSDDTDFDVVGGNPTTANQKGGEVTALRVTGINGNTSKVLLQFSIVGEWDGQEYEKGVVIARRTSDTIGGTYADDTILRADDASARTRFIQNFTISFPANHDSTLECCNGIYIDTPTPNKFHEYTVVLVNSEASTVTKKFHLNRTDRGLDSNAFEVGVSCLTAQEF